MNWESTGGIFDFQDTAGSGPALRITNNIIYGVSSTVFLDDHHISGIHIGSRTTSYVLNNTIFNIYNQGGGNPSGAARGLTVKAFPNATGTATVIATNNVVGDVRADNDLVARCYNTEENAVLTQSFNVASDNTASGTGSVDWATSSRHVLRGRHPRGWTNDRDDRSPPARHLGVAVGPKRHRSVGGLPARRGQPTAQRSVGHRGGRVQRNDRGRADVSFEASPGDSAVELSRGARRPSSTTSASMSIARLSENGPWERITPSLIPGLGSSPEGASYSWTDTGLVNGTPLLLPPRGHRHRLGVDLPRPGLRRAPAGDGGAEEGEGGAAGSLPGPEPVPGRRIPRARRAASTRRGRDASPESPRRSAPTTAAASTATPESPRSASSPDPLTR